MRANGLPWFPQIHKSHHNNKGLFIYLQDKSLAEELVAVDFCRGAETQRGFGSGMDLAKAHFHSAARESGFILCEKASRVPA
jgi:hypothetical protein